MINILFEDNHILVVEKPVNIPVMEDSSQDEDLLSLLKQDIKVRYDKPGNVYLGLVHRLDRPVGGLMVFAKTSKAAQRLSKQIQANQVKKQYLAIVTKPTKQADTLIDYLAKNKQSNTSYVSSKSDKLAKYAELSYECLSHTKELSYVKINLKTGRSHQIRVQFSSRGHALWGDQRYNPQAKVGQQIALWAHSLTFEHPTTKEQCTFVSTPPQQHPWNLFKGGNQHD